MNSDSTPPELERAERLLESGHFHDAWAELYHASQKDSLTKAQKEAVALAKFDIEQRYAAKVSLACVDLKLTAKGEVKVLEFGLGVTSSFEGINQLTPDYKAMPRLADAALNEGLPPIFFGSPPGVNLVPQLDKAVPYFSQVDDLPRDIGDISTYNCIYGGIELRTSPLAICAMDDARLRYAFAHKDVMHRVMERAGLDAYRPKVMLIERHNNSRGLAARIKEELPGNRYVIKAPDVENGNGVIIATDTDLEQHLGKLMNPNPLDMLDPTYMNLMRSSSSYLMVEAYISSKPVAKAEKLYDATIRTVFWYIRDKQESRCVPVASYWKLPAQPIAERSASLRDRTVSSFQEQRVSVVALSAEDEHTVHSVVANIVPTVFDQMIQMNFLDEINQLPRYTNLPIYLSFGRDQQRLAYGNYLALQGCSEVAHHCLNQITAPNNAMMAVSLNHFKGIACYAGGDIDGAIGYFRAEMQSSLPPMDNADIRLFLAYMEKGDANSAWQCVAGGQANRKAQMVLNVGLMDLTTSVLLRKNEGNALFKKASYQQALEIYTSIVSQHPQYAVAWFNVGSCYRRLGEDVKAIGAYTKAIEFKPGYTKAIVAQRELVDKTRKTADEKAPSSGDSSPHVKSPSL